MLGRESFFLDRVLEGSGVAARISTITGTVSMAPRYLIEVVVVLFVVTLVFVIYMQAGSLEASYPLVGMFGVAAMRIGPAITMVISNTAILRNQRHGLGVVARDLSELTTIPCTQSECNTSAALPAFSSLELENVTFCYKGSNRPALNRISLTIPAGESVGIVGASGSGKTTLVDVVLGLLVPQSGRILCNGNQLSPQLREWYERVAYLPQEVFLSDQSIKRNIALGIEDLLIDDAVLRQAICQARLSDLIKELPSGIDTLIGERGVRLSGGQRQRVALARAFYHRREVLIMDEATSALDDETEREIVRAIQDFKGNKTMIVIAHRVSTLQHCDRIYRLSEGRIVESGTYQEVIQGR